MKKNKHLLVGIAIISLYYLNTYIIHIGLYKYTEIKFANMDPQEVVKLLELSTSEQNLLYYVLVFKAMFILYLVLTILISIIHRKKLKAKLYQTYQKRYQIIRKLLMYIGIMITITICLYAVSYFLLGDPTSLIGDNQAMINQVVLGAPNIYVFVVVLILAPIIEEYIFRYGLINNLLKNRNVILKVIISALIFSFIHVGFSQLNKSIIEFGYLMLLYLPMAIVYSYVYVKEKSIVYPLSLHILNNIGSIIIIYVLN